MQEITITDAKYMLCIIMAALAVLVPLLGYIIERMVRGLFRRSSPEWLKILRRSFSRPLRALVFTFFAGIALIFLPAVSERQWLIEAVTKIQSVLMIVCIAKGAWNASTLCRIMLRTAQNRLDVDTSKTITQFFENMYRVSVVGFSALSILDTLGVPVRTFLTGAGIIGITVSLAAQSTVANLIAGVVLILEHPFGIGDYIVLGDYEGTVEDISFRSTSIRTPDNVLIVVENSKVSNEYIQNTDRRTSRLWETKLSIAYGQSPCDLRGLCSKLETMLNKHPDVQEGSVDVIVKSFAPNCINLLVRVYITRLPYRDFLEAQGRLNLAMMDLIQKEGGTLCWLMPRRSGANGGNAVSTDITQKNI